MSYNFLSNINNFDNFNNPDAAYTEVHVDDEIKFIENDIPHTASFLMVRAHNTNDLLIQLMPWGYGVYIPADEMWSVDSLDNVEKIIIKKIFSVNEQGQRSEITSGTGKIQWMIGYK